MRRESQNDFADPVHLDADGLQTTMARAVAHALSCANARESRQGRGERDKRATGRGTIRLVASVCLGLLGMLNPGTGTVRRPCNGQKTDGGTLLYQGRCPTQLS